jgi:hypothetical protein
MLSFGLIRWHWPGILVSFRRSELTYLHRIVEEHQEYFLAAWHEHFST